MTNAQKRVRLRRQKEQQKEIDEIVQSWEDENKRFYDRIFSSKKLTEMFLQCFFDVYDYDNPEDRKLYNQAIKSLSDEKIKK